MMGVHGIWGMFTGKKKDSRTAMSWIAVPTLIYQRKPDISCHILLHSTINLVYNSIYACIRYNEMLSQCILGIYALIPSILLVFFHALSYGGAFSHALSYGIFQAGQVICKFLYPCHRHLHINPLPLHSLLQSVQLSMRTDRSCNSGRQDSRGICQIPR